MLNFLVFLPLASTLLFAEQIYLALGQDAGMAREAALMIYISLPGYLAFGFYNAYQRFLNGQKEVRYTMWINIVSTLIHAPTAYYLGITLDL